jgi:predicted dehydrogenase
MKENNSPNPLNYPIYIIGAGSIVRDAHLPAYKKAGYDVAGIWNRNRETAENLARHYGIEKVFDSVDTAIAHAPTNAIWDLTLPANLFVKYLERLPTGAAVLIQKPMGESIEEARSILEVCRRKKLIAAINFQLRFAPFVAAARELIASGRIGELRDIEARVTVHTPWEYFAFLQHVPRMEIVYHSIHYIDLIRSFIGDPIGMYAKTLQHPELMDLPESRSSIILDYGNRVRANIQTNHFHKFGYPHQESYIKWEGTHGAIKARMGLLMNYPDGVPDTFEVCQLKDDKDPVWESKPIEGSWFPDAFIGSMGQIMQHLEDPNIAMPTSVEDAFHTMACVEAAYTSSTSGGVPISQYI